VRYWGTYELAHSLRRTDRAITTERRRKRKRERERGREQRDVYERGRYPCIFFILEVIFARFTAQSSKIGILTLRTFFSKTKCGNPPRSPLIFAKRSARYHPQHGQSCESRESFVIRNCSRRRENVRAYVYICTRTRAYVQVGNQTRQNPRPQSLSAAGSDIFSCTYAC